VAQVPETEPKRQASGLDRGQPDVRPVGAVDRAAITSGEDQPGWSHGRPAGVRLVVDLLGTDRAHGQVRVQCLTVDRRLCSRVHNFAPVHSIYRWQGEVHERTEGRASLHTRRSLVPAIVEYAKDRHPYQVPGISARPIYDGNPEYLDWIVAETGPATAASDTEDV
jgi:periplasmic divalent cation tolerance protein